MNVICRATLRLPWGPGPVVLGRSLEAQYTLAGCNKCGQGIDRTMKTPTHTRRDFLKLVGTGAAALTLARTGAAASAVGDRPNILVILADDLGYGDLSSYGATDLKSPNIDRLVAAGMRFDNFYANCPVCSPTRAALMTGPVSRPRRRARRDPHARHQQLGLPAPAGRAAAADAQTRRLPHGPRRQMAPGPGLAEHAQRARLRPLPRLPRRHDGRLLHPPPARLQLHAAERQGDRSPRDTPPTCSRIGPSTTCREARRRRKTQPFFLYLPTTPRTSRSSRRRSGWTASSSASPASANSGRSSSP